VRWGLLVCLTLLGVFFSGFVWTNMAKVEVPEKELANLAGFFWVFLECFGELKWQEWELINKC
jgi:hypothetical protein